MANQELKVWAQRNIPDAVKGNNQVRDITEEEWIQGITRLGGISVQSYNQLMRLVTSCTHPVSYVPFLHKLSNPIPSSALEMNGQATPVDTVIREVYGATLDDLTADAPTGWTYCVRNY